MARRINAQIKSSKKRNRKEKLHKHLEQRNRFKKEKKNLLLENA